MRLVVVAWDLNVVSAWIVVNTLLGRNLFAVHCLEYVCVCLFEINNMYPGIKLGVFY